jgi:hypothetical protein
MNRPGRDDLPTLPGNTGEQAPDALWNQRDRLLFRQHEEARLATIADRLTIAGLLALCLAIVGAAVVHHRRAVRARGGHGDRDPERRLVRGTLVCPAWMARPPPRGRAGAPELSGGLPKGLVGPVVSRVAQASSARWWMRPGVLPWP